MAKTQNLDLLQSLSKPLLNLSESRVLVCYLDNQFFQFPVRSVMESDQLVSASVYKKVQDQERCALVAISESVISSQRLAERGGFTRNSPVIPSVRATNRRLDRCQVSNTGSAAESQRQCMGLENIALSNAIVPNELALRQSFKGVFGARRSFAQTIVRLLRDSNKLATFAVSASHSGIAMTWQWNMLALSSAWASVRFSDRDKLATSTVAAAYSRLRAAPVFGHRPIIGSGAGFDPGGVVLRGEVLLESPGR